MPKLHYNIELFLWQRYTATTRNFSFSNIFLFKDEVILGCSSSGEDNTGSLSGAATYVKATSVTISTIPRSGPFVIGQTVQFSCEVHPSANASFRWIYVYYNGYGTSTAKALHITIHENTIRYPLVFCMASLSGVTLGKATKVIEVNGKYIHNNI